MTNLPPHFGREKKKEVMFHIPGAFPTTMIPGLTKEYFPTEYKSIVVRCAETFYRLRESTAL